MPNYNKASFISQSIESCLSQTYKYFELIVIDDGSTDNSVSIILEFTKTDDRIKFFKREGNIKGGNICRNQGIKYSSGEYIVFLDSDDLMLPDCLEDRVSVIDANKNDFSIFNVGVFNNTIGDRKYVWSTNSIDDHLILFLKHNLPWNISSPIWSSGFLKKINGFNESLERLQDVELHTRALLNTNNYNVYSNSKPKIYYRVSVERMTVSPYDFLLKFVNGCIQYVLVTRITLANFKKQNCNVYLNGTLAIAYFKVLNAYRENLINWSQKRKLCNLILKSREKNERSMVQSFALKICHIFFFKNFLYLKGSERLVKAIFLKL